MSTPVRLARCASCGTERPSSSPGLAFFEACGDGSIDAQRCICGYFECAHDPAHMATLVPGRHGKPRPTVIESGHCTGYQPRGDRGTDRFYCGCRGWD
jgi:hypothetical protein